MSDYRPGLADVFEVPGVGWFVPPQPEAARAGTVHAGSPVYRWRWRRVLGDRHGELFIVTARGGRNSCRVMFLRDGYSAITSRNALRRA